MTAVHGYNESFDYKHMYDMTDWRGPKPQPTIFEDTPMCFIKDTLFGKIIKLAIQGPL